MAAENFASSLRRVLVHEGGYSNDAGDPGGATMWGITHIDYDAYRRLKRVPPQDVRLMTTAERDEIYRKKYWSGGRCDELPSGVDYCLFDGAVNSGVAQSVKWLQRALEVKADGHIGDQTLLAAEQADPRELVHSMCEQRRAFLRSLRTFSRFGKGWIRRVNDVEAAASGLASVHHDDDGLHSHATDAGAKASSSDIAPPAVSPGTATASTAATSAAAATVQTVQDQLSPLSETLSALKWVLLACALIGLGLTVYSIWKANQVRAVE